jgi:predicted heme/steroid binding protein
MKISTVLFTATLVSILAIAGIAGEKQTDPSAPVDKASTDMQKMKKTESDSMAPLLSLTVEQLSQYDGTKGKPAYVAVDGVIYDLTGIKAWKKGRHKGRHTAGTELSKEIKKNSPHGLQVLKKLKVVGKIVPVAQ